MDYDSLFRFLPGSEEYDCLPGMGRVLARWHACKGRMPGTVSELVAWWAEMLRLMAESKVVMG
jgi:hypothetical protein